MAKRANPYLEDFVPQSKTHVGIKQFNNNVERLQQVYEKTLQMLFKGAKKPTVPREALHLHKADDSAETETALRGDKKLKQLAIGKDGALLHDANVDTKVNTRSECKCGDSGSHEQYQCAYCEVPLCGHCGRACARCQRPHCTRCSLTRSEGEEVCVSCYE